MYNLQNIVEVMLSAKQKYQHADGQLSVILAYLFVLKEIKFRKNR